jgi:hypothetical protein
MTWRCFVSNSRCPATSNRYRSSGRSPSTLTAILNSNILTLVVRPFQARGEHNPRDFDKYVFQVPIPMYGADDADHQQLVALAERAEHVAAGAELPNVRFEHQRLRVREVLAETGITADMDAIVKKLLT